MTADIDTELDVELYPLTTAPIAVIAAEHDVIDSALAALAESHGLRPVIIDLDTATDTLGGIEPPVIVLVRSTLRVAQVRAVHALRHAVICGIGIVLTDPDSIDITDSPDALDTLRRRLGTGTIGVRRYRPRVHLTEREREVLTRYALGATLRDTAREFFIAESTAREHYRRVRQRYIDSGRPIANKAELLLALISDGWVQPDQL